MVHREQSQHPSASLCSSQTHHIHNKDVKTTANNKKFKLVYEGAKFDQFGYCLKYPMVCLCNNGRGDGLIRLSVLEHVAFVEGSKTIVVL